jgi:isocitrate/isopropylmalate dehydrogenase
MISEYSEIRRSTTVLNVKISNRDSNASSRDRPRHGRGRMNGGRTGPTPGSDHTLKRVVIIEGEDSAPEAMKPTLALLQGLGLPIEWDMPPVGRAGIEAHGDPFPEQARRSIDASDATLFGATSGLSARAILYLRWGKNTYANVRPARWRPGYRSPMARPEGIDLVIVRENLEDLYLGVEGEIEELAPLALQSRTAGRPVADYAPGRFALKVISEAGSRRVIRFAFELARSRKAAGHPGRVTCSSKYNMLPQSDGLFREVAQAVANDFPDVELQTLIVDDLAQRLVTQPHELDVVVLPNLYGDILSDLAGGVVGGLGVAPSGCYGDDYAYFESAHGSAPDIAGRGIVNPTATILSAAMMLGHLGFDDAGTRLDDAVTAVFAEGKVLTPDQGGSATTIEFCDAVARVLEKEERHA